MFAELPMVFNQHIILKCGFRAETADSYSGSEEVLELLSSLLAQRVKGKKRHSPLWSEEITQGESQDCSATRQWSDRGHALIWHSVVITGMTLGTAYFQTTLEFLFYQSLTLLPGIQRLFSLTTGERRWMLLGLLIGHREGCMNRIGREGTAAGGRGTLQSPQPPTPDST